MRLMVIIFFLNVHFNFNCIHRSQRTLYQISTIKRSLNIDKITLSPKYFLHLSAELVHLLGMHICDMKISLLLAYASVCC
jgi:hypothetical protein